MAYLWLPKTFWLSKFSRAIGVVFSEFECRIGAARNFQIQKAISCGSPKVRLSNRVSQHL